MGTARSRSTKSGPSTAYQHLKQQLQAVDLIIEVCDARLPVSSRHPKAGELFGDKPRLLVLAKQDLAEPEALKAWLAKLDNQPRQMALCLSLKLNKGQDKLVSLALKLTEEKRARLLQRGLLPRPMRACVVGLPNVGKSSLINWLIGKRKTKVGDRPGITRGAQWVMVHKQLELLDTPGILPPVAFEPSTRLKLSLCNILPGEHYDLEEVAELGLSIIAALNPAALSTYAPDFAEKGPSLENLAKARLCLTQGSRPDRARAAAIFLNDLRSGRLGRLVLDNH